MFEFLNTYPWLLPFVIFFGRIFDVTLGTLRIIFVSKGEKYLAPLVGFFEVFIWVVIISRVLAQANDVVAYASYAAGYAAGNFVGIIIEQRIAFGVILYRIYTKKPGLELMKLLNQKDFGSTLISAQGAKGDVDIVETVINRKSAKELDATIMGFDKESFYIIEDIRSKRRGVFDKATSIFSYRRPGK